MVQTSKIVPCKNYLTWPISSEVKNYRNLPATLPKPPPLPPSFPPWSSGKRVLTHWKWLFPATFFTFFNWPVQRCYSTTASCKTQPNVPDMSTGYHTRFPGFLTTLVEGFSSKLFYRNLSQKVKGKRPKLTNIKQKDSVDIEGILKRPGAVVGSAESLVVDSSETTKGIEIKTWQASRQRTNLLKQGERRCTFQVFYSQFRRN